MKLDSCMKTNPKWLNDFNVRPKTLNLLQEKGGEIFQDTKLVRTFGIRLKEVKK